ncbi:MAG: hypothetical protein RR248_05200 [Clostridia bacterium]
MSSSSGIKGYFGLGYFISLIFTIIPVTCWLFGILTAFSRKNYLFGVIRIFFGWFFWLVDLFCMIVYKKIWILI